MIKNDLSEADLLYALLIVIDSGRNRLVDGSGFNGVDLARVKLAVDMQTRGTGFMFRALMEGWTLEQVNRELY